MRGIEMKYVITVEPAKLDGDELWEATIEGYPDLFVFEDTPEDACASIIDCVETLTTIKETQ